MTMDVNGYAAATKGAALVPFSFKRRDPGPADVVIDILFCGVCHTDMSMVNNEWGFSAYPMVPGHEIVGRVTAVGAGVTKFAVGDLAGIGTIVDSCRHCTNCEHDMEQFCLELPTQTYSTPDRHGDGLTFGGYSNAYVVEERFAFRIPDSIDPAAAAPLLCAGITTYSPLRRWKVGPGHTIGIIGLGGLGHVAVQFAHAMGAQVVLFTTSAGKEDDARRFGADEIVLSSDPDAMAARQGTLDFLLDTVAAPHDLNAYLALLKTHGTMCMVGMPEAALPIYALSLTFGGKMLAGSGVGGMIETQEMLDFAGEHGIAAEIETIALPRINEAFERLGRNDVRYRFVIDMQAG